jgi:hypothetical protein
MMTMTAGHHIQVFYRMHDRFFGLCIFHMSIINFLFLPVASTNELANPKVV